MLSASAKLRCVELLAKATHAKNLETIQFILFESLGFFVETSKSRPTHARLRNRELADEAELISLSVG